MKQTILLVEDEPFFTRMCERALARPQRQITCLRDGASAMREIQRSPPDLLLLDLLLDGTDGFSVLEFLHEEKLSIPTIILSNLGQDIDTALCKDLGAYEYCLKSETTLEDLAKRVDTYLPRR